MPPTCNSKPPGEEQAGIPEAGGGPQGGGSATTEAAGGATEARKGARAYEEAKRGASGPDRHR